MLLTRFIQSLIIFPVAVVPSHIGSRALAAMFWSGIPTMFTLLVIYKLNIARKV